MTSIWPAIVGGLTLGLFMAISVGPTLFAVIRYSLHHSYKSGLAFILGVSFSDILYVALANLATPWLRVVEDYWQVLGYGGGALLVGIGLLGLLRKHKPVRPSTQATKTLNTNAYLKIFASGFFINTINPGVLINWVAAVTIIAGKGWVFRSIFFGVCLLLVLGIDVLKVALADKIRGWLTPRRILYLQRTSAAILLGFGLFLITMAALDMKPSPEVARLRNRAVFGEYAMR